MVIFCTECDQCDSDGHCSQPGALRWKVRCEGWWAAWWPGGWWWPHSCTRGTIIHGQESGGGGGGIWSSPDDSRAVIILAILLSAAAKSPSAIKTFCGAHETLWIRNAWHKDSHWSKWAINALLLADHNFTTLLLNKVHRTDDELKHWAIEDDKFSINDTFIMPIARYSRSSPSFVQNI